MLNRRNFFVSSASVAASLGPLAVFGGSSASVPSVDQPYRVERVKATFGESWCFAPNGKRYVGLCAFREGEPTERAHRAAIEDITKGVEFTKGGGSRFLPKEVFLTDGIGLTTYRPKAESPYWTRETVVTSLLRGVRGWEWNCLADREGGPNAVAEYDNGRSFEFYGSVRQKFGVMPGQPQDHYFDSLVISDWTSPGLNV